MIIIKAAFVAATSNGLHRRKSAKTDDKLSTMSIDEKHKEKVKKNFTVANNVI